ncbi:hypothetical protein [Microbacterium sp. NPDC089695]|uniref:hypothetical protein n=1 Tax=Microbacterium sp. NPDC089695 TaxID=3364198 RepID=UPI0037F415BA
MNTVIEVDHELFDVEGQRQPDGTFNYQFSWTNGPAGGTYGFAVGGAELGHEELEHQVRGFIQTFFAPDGVGATDFPDFLEARNSSEL